VECHDRNHRDRPDRRPSGRQRSRRPAGVARHPLGRLRPRTRLAPRRRCGPAREPAARGTAAQEERARTGSLAWAPRPALRRQHADLRLRHGRAHGLHLRFAVRLPDAHRTERDRLRHSLRDQCDRHVPDDARFEPAQSARLADAFGRPRPDAEHGRRHIELGEIGYGIAFAINAIGMSLTTLASNRLNRRYSLMRLAGTGLTLSMVGVLATLASAFAGIESWPLMIPLFIAIAPLGMV